MHSMNHAEKRLPGTPTAFFKPANPVPTTEDAPGPGIGTGWLPGYCTRKYAHS